MKAILAAIAAVLMGAEVAHAQTSQATSQREYEVGYVEGVAQSAFGNVTSQSFGVEGGVNVGASLRVFAEVGRTGDTAPESLGAGAQLIAGYLTQTQSGAVSFSVKQPVLFIAGGARYMIPYDEKIEPYVTGGFGLARIKRDVGFSIAGTDVTDSLGTYGVVLGTDLSGTASRPMMTLGGGALWNIRTTVFVDFQYRFGRIFDSGQAFNVNRAGVGVGVRF
jgi:opacity protein-like surface antigen